jgi:hypothetical protein
MPQQMYETIVGGPDKGFYKMTESDIQRFYLVKPMGSSVTHVKEIRQQQLAMAQQLLTGVAPVAMSGPQPFSINWYEAAKSGLYELDIKNIDQLLIPIAPQQAQMMMSQQEQKQMQQIRYGEEVKVGTQAKYNIIEANNQLKNDAILEEVKAKLAPSKPEVRK